MAFIRTANTQTMNTIINVLENAPVFWSKVVPKKCNINTKKILPNNPPPKWLIASSFTLSKFFLLIRFPP